MQVWNPAGKSETLNFAKIVLVWIRQDGFLIPFIAGFYKLERAVAG